MGDARARCLGALGDARARWRGALADARARWPTLDAWALHKIFFFMGRTLRSPVRK